MQQWAFHLQVFFLGHRARQHLQLARSPRSAIIDRSIYEDAEIFAKAALEIGSVTDRDYRTYRQVFDLVVGTLPTPDLLIFLRAELPVLLDRIGSRGRDMERGISIDYLSLLERLYVEWMAGFDLCPTLTIRTDDLDFVHEPRHLALVESRIRDKLAGKEEIAFPSE
jgi:deoxyadenosine/deoxycytidine kinase